MAKSTRVGRYAGNFEIFFCFNAADVALVQKINATHYAKTAVGWGPRPARPALKRWWLYVR
jgi:hypothetical protein